MDDNDSPDFNSTRPSASFRLPVSQFSIKTLAVLGALICLGLLVGTGTFSNAMRRADEMIHPPSHPKPAVEFPPLNMPQVKPKLRGKHLPTRPSGKKESVAELMYKIFNADELGLDWNWDWRQEQPGAMVNGKKQRVVVMHADTRPLQGWPDVQDDPFRFEHLTMGPMYVMWWAMRHGYDYRWVRLIQPDVCIVH